MPLTIEIDDEPTPPEKFHGGDVIKGRVKIVNETGKCRLLSQDLVISFIGKANSSWKEPRRHSSHMRQYLITVWDEDFYFHEKLVLQNQDSSIHNRDIRPGTSIYPFEFQLPLGLPESYSSSKGSVTYSVEVVYPRSWRGDQVIRKEFQVGGHFDLNCFPECCQPGYFTMEKKFWLGFGKVRAVLFLPRRGFTPGETVNFSLEVFNESRWYLKKIRVYFCQVTTYFAKGSEYKEGARLHKIKCKPVHPKEAKSIEGSILVPYVPPTELGGCRLIHPQYGIQIKVIATTLGKMVKSVVLEGRVPIVIGTVPSTQVFNGLAHSVTVINSSPMEQTSEFINSSEVGSESQDCLDDQTSASQGFEGFTDICGGASSEDPQQQQQQTHRQFEKPPTYEEALSGTSTPVPTIKDPTHRTNVYTPVDSLNQR